MEPKLNATLYTEHIGEDYFQYRVDGYRHNDATWAKVVVGGVALIGIGDEGLEGMQRLIDALTAAITKARQAELDEKLDALPGALKEAFEVTP